MPTYVYKCQACGKEFDQFQRMSDPEPPCPDCKSTQVQQQITAPASVQFKGTGFYQTDYKGK